MPPMTVPEKSTVWHYQGAIVFLCLDDRAPDDQITNCAVYGL